MKSFIAAPLAAVALASPIPSQSTTFGGIAIRSGSDIQYASVNANGGQFWLGKNTTTYCPGGNIPCPDNSSPETVFTTAGTGTLSLNVAVPGGQQIYVTPDGLLKFTQAHSASTGQNGTLTGFQLTDGHLQFETNDWIACPQANKTYSVYAASRAANNSCNAACLGFAFRAENTTSSTESVWQYE